MNVYTSDKQDALLFDGATSRVSFAGAAFAGSQATFAVRAYTASDDRAVRRQLFAFNAAGLGTIAIVSTGGEYGISLVL